MLITDLCNKALLVWGRILVVSELLIYACWQRRICFVCYYWEAPVYNTYFVYVIKLTFIIGGGRDSFGGHL